MKITVLARPSSSTSILLNWLDREGFTDLDVVLEEAPMQLQKVRQRARRLGWMHALGQAALMACVLPLLRRQVVTRRQQLLSEYNLDENMPCVGRSLMVEKINDPIVVEHLRERAPNVILSERNTHYPYTCFKLNIIPLYQHTRRNYS
jgi:hypothetical protein